MPSNSAEYQRQYRLKNAKRRKEVSVALPIDLHREFSAFAKEQGMSLAGLMREATDLQICGSKLKSREVTEELRQLRFLLANIANNVNQMAHHSNRVQQVIDENGVFEQLHELEKLIVGFTDTRLKQAP